MCGDEQNKMYTNRRDAFCASKGPSSAAVVRFARTKGCFLVAVVVVMLEMLGCQDLLTSSKIKKGSGLKYVLMPSGILELHLYLLTYTYTCMYFFGTYTYMPPSILESHLYLLHL